jgi:tRNA(Ile)-lysidine synthase
VSALHQQVRRTIRRHRLFPPGAAVVVGVSGGSDSVALTHVLLDLSEHGEFRVVSLAHLNHRLRASAERDEQFCRDLAVRVGLPLSVEHADVLEYARSERLSIEDAARRLRYDFLERAASRTAADRIAVGHTRDDQAETFLLKLIRGAGPAGLGGVYPRKGRVVRPLLDVTRTDLRRYLESKGIVWVEDESNLDLENPRNRVRHRVLPELERAAGGSVTASIARAADLSREDAMWLDDLGLALYEEIAVETAGGLELDAARLAAAPIPIIRRVILKALRVLAGEREVGLEHVMAAGEVLAGSCRGASVPGGRVELRRGNLALSRQDAGPGAPFTGS